MKSLALVLLLLCFSAWGAVVSENNWATAQNTGAVSSITTPNVIVGSGANRLLLCDVAYWTGTSNTTATVSTVTFNGQALTFLDSQRISVFSGNAVTEIWYLKAPSNTSAPALLNWSASVSEAAAICHSLTGVNQASTFGAVGKASDTLGDSIEPSATVGSQSGAVVEALAWYDQQTPQACLLASDSSARGCDGYPQVAWALGRTGFATHAWPGASNVTASQ